MIAQETIQQVFDRLDIVEVLQPFVELKRSGSSYKGLSPFVQEKTPSFMVSQAKQIFKCFSSGKGGTAVTFLMEHKGLTYPEAIEHIANQYNITVQRTEVKEADKPAQDHLQTLQRVLQAAQNNYRQNLWAQEADHPAMQELVARRQLTKDSIVQWGLGFAPDEWRWLTDKVLDKGYFGYCQELGLTNHKNGNNYDIMRGRITFPIHDHRDRLVGMAGRLIIEGSPKYLNSPDTKLYKKDRVLYGLNHAAQAIRKAGFAYITEGYFDVLSMHQAGAENTVATCGTALTPGHLALLKRYCNHIVLLYDGDAAGLRATEKALIAATAANFKAEVVTLPDGKDPDDLARELISQSDLETAALMA